MALLTNIIFLIILLLISGFFSGIEIAFFSLSNLRLRHLVKKKVHGSKSLQRLKARPHRLLITILVGNNLANISAASLATIIAVDLFGSKGAGISVGVMTFLVLIFGEITPKSIATMHAEKISLMVARPMEILQPILSPITYLLDKIISLLTRQNNFSPEIKKITEEELRDIVDVSYEHGEIETKEKEMIHKIFEFDDIPVRRIMVPLPEMIMAELNTPLNALMNLIVKNRYTRIPIYKENKNNIIGILHTKEVLSLLAKGEMNINLKSLLRMPWIVEGHKKIDELLYEMQKRRTHIVLVKNKKNKIIGLTTMEDILEEIHGEIYDENDQIREMLRRQKKHLKTR